MTRQRLAHAAWSAIVVGVALSGCATLRATSTAAPNEVHWFHNAAEAQAIYTEVYASATDAVRHLSAGLAPGSWGVILDVDETALDNSAYEMRLAHSGQSYTPASWNAWVHERSAPALPGSRAFINTVLDDLHGHIVFVTNRDQSQCADTEANLRAQGLRYDEVLCNSGDGDKNPRFQLVIDGTAAQPAMNVLLWIGDNIEDFPGLDQQHRGNPALFGSRYFVLPNPMYGSWQQVADP